jgi:biofilm PGA synthesis N-glycosyltransferase PgaC
MQMHKRTDLNIKYNKNTNFINLLNRKIYISTKTKFILSHLFALIWASVSILISIPWLADLSKEVTFPVAVITITGLAYIPGYLNAFLVIGLILDRQPAFKIEFPSKDITILIAAKNEADSIQNTLSYIARQDYTGKIKVIVIDNCSTDNTSINALEAGKKLGIDLTLLKEGNYGKFNALNTGISKTSTELVITLDADTLLHKSAIRYLVARIESSPDDVFAVAGSVLVRNSRQNILARIQEWDYFLGIASIKRLQGLYQGTLVAQGAYSIYKTNQIRNIGGWPNAIGEDIVLTWKLLKNGGRVFFEPFAVAFTEVPVSMHGFSRQRSRWARGMIEALKEIMPWHQPRTYTKYLTGINLLMPFLDLTYTICWLPGLVLAFFGVFWIVGPMTLLVIPLTFISYSILYFYQKKVFRKLDLKIRKNIRGFILFVLFYQMLMSPVSVWGYLKEFLKLERVWK